MVFCNYKNSNWLLKLYHCHNPYFSRWFSAIVWNWNIQQKSNVTILILVDGFLQCLFSITKHKSIYNVTILILVDGFLQWYNHFKKLTMSESHNPYFSRWFSAIELNMTKGKGGENVTILILVDGFLQFDCWCSWLQSWRGSQSLF